MSQPACAPAKFSRSDPSPGISTIAATTTTTSAPTISSERRSRDEEKSSGSGSASIPGGGSRYSTVNSGRSLMRATPC